ncbi:MAG: NADase-type glycan-binding domain-containing protein [Myxococcota bacterium]
MLSTTFFMLGFNQMVHAGSAASSELKKDDVRYAASAAFDGLLNTSWAEGEDGQGDGAWLELKLSGTTEIKTLHIWPGKLDEGERSYKYHARPRKLTILLDGSPLEQSVFIEDKMQRVDIKVNNKAKVIRIQVDQSYEGRVFGELHIAEVAINMAETGPIKKLRSWQKGREASRMDEAFKREIEDRYTDCKAAEFGDKAALDFIGQAAADGPLYLQKKAKSYVGDGYRIQAIQSHPFARKALRKLKDPNAIPYLEKAMLRTTGQEQREILNTVSYYKAFQELVGGINHNPQNWGESGWSLGELQHFGEPLPVEINRSGELYLADIGNNRIQKFNEDGRAVQFWGAPKPEITDIWYAKGREFYVSGSAPGETTGLFQNPVDVELLPEKEADAFATLEANGRIQVYDIDGQPLRSMRFAHDYPAEGGLGGTAYLAYLPKKNYLCAIVQDQGSCFSRETGDQIGESWTIEDGSPNALEVLRNDTILMAFGDKIISYAFDGFRKKVLFDEAIIGKGFESIDISLDEKGKLWLLTDEGVLFKFKKPGKIEYQLQVVDHPLRNPRFAVIEDFVYISSDSRIETIDVRQRLIDLEDEAKEATE